jgi:hypothetical protein
VKRLDRNIKLSRAGGAQRLGAPSARRSVIPNRSRGFTSGYLLRASPMRINRPFGPDGSATRTTAGQRVAKSLEYPSRVSRLCVRNNLCNFREGSGVLQSSVGLSWQEVRLFLLGGMKMKKILGITLAVASLGMGLSAELKASERFSDSSTVLAANANAGAQWRRDRWSRRVNRRQTVRRATTSRVVRFGRRLYRETYLVTYLPNGRTNTRLVSRVRIS